MSVLVWVLLTMMMSRGIIEQDRELRLLVFILVVWSVKEEGRHE